MESLARFDDTFMISDRRVGRGAPAYVIAEIGSNHDQDIDKARELIDAAAEAGASAAKFQSLRYEKVHLPSAYDDDYRSFFSQIELEESWYPVLAEQCRQSGIHFLSSVTYLEAVDLLVSAGAPAIKIASAQFDILPEVIEKAARTGLPLVMSTGLAEMDGVHRMMDLVADAGGRKVALLQCVTAYPAPLDATNLRIMNTFEREFGCVTGYSDHTLGNSAVLAAVALGAKVIERHLTLDRDSAGPDHHFAVTPDNLADMVRHIREVEKVLGDGVMPPLGSQEREQRDAFLYKLVTRRDISAGTPFDTSDFVARRAPGGIDHLAADELKGCTLAKDLSVGTLLLPEHLA